jgi:hypothetical protein
VRKPPPRRRLGTCVVCRTRKARYAKGPTCEPCHHLTEAEGTAKKLGVENPRHTRWRKRIQDYNALVRKGMKQHQIAKLWNVSASALSTSLRKTAPRVGLKVAVSRQVVVPAAPKQQPVAKRTNNRHGEGWGIKDCHCDGCLAARRHRRMLANRRYRAKMKLQKQQQKQGDMPS